MDAASVPRLNDECLAAILQWLPFKQRSQLRCVSHHWNDVVVPMSFTSVTNLNVKNGSSTDVENNLRMSISSMTNLKHLSISSQKLKGKFQETIGKSLISISIDVMCSLDQNHLENFLSNHSQLKVFKLSTDVCGNCSALAKVTPTLLSQYCCNLEELHLASSGPFLSDPNSSNTFAIAFKSLTKLNTLKVCTYSYFDDLAMKNLCENCPNLEELLVDNTAVRDLRPIRQLTKLRKVTIDMKTNAINEEFIAALCEGSGKTLEYLDIESDYFSNTTLLNLNILCGLTELKIGDKLSLHLTKDGFNDFLTAITHHLNWNAPLSTRHLHICVPKSSAIAKVNVDSYGGRVILTTRPPTKI